MVTEPEFWVVYGLLIQPWSNWIKGKSENVFLIIYQNYIEAVNLIEIMWTSGNMLKIDLAYVYNKLLNVIQPIAVQL